MRIKLLTLINLQSSGAMLGFGMLMAIGVQLVLRLLLGDTTSMGLEFFAWGAALMGGVIQSTWALPSAFQNGVTRPQLFASGLLTIIALATGLAGLQWGLRALTALAGGTAVAGGLGLMLLWWQLILLLILGSVCGLFLAAKRRLGGFLLWLGLVATILGGAFAEVKNRLPQTGIWAPLQWLWAHPLGLIGVLVIGSGLLLPWLRHQYLTVEQGQSPEVSR